MQPWEELDRRFNELLSAVSDRMPADQREYAVHYWQHGEWELAFDHFGGVPMTTSEQAETEALAEKLRVVYGHATVWTRLRRLFRRR